MWLLKHVQLTYRARSILEGWLNEDDDEEYVPSDDEVSDCLIRNVSLN